MERKNRESGIELLRILAIVGVIVLHYNAGRAFVYCTNERNYAVLCMAESIFICAVDVFVLISGYFLCTSQKRNISKVLELYFQLTIVQMGVYFWNMYENSERLNVRGILRQFIPDNYFIVLYIVLYLISPYLNIVLNSLGDRKRTRMVFLLVILFSVYPVIVDLWGEIRGQAWFGLSTISAYGSQYGVSITNFILLYIIGAYIRLNGIHKKQNKAITLILVWVIDVIGIYVWSLANEHFTEIGLRSAWVYHNPLVIISAVLLFLIFQKIRKENKFINRLAQGSFMCYLVHLNFLDKFQIEKYANESVAAMLGHMVFTALSLYGISYGIYLLYQLLLGKLFRKLQIWIDLTEQ